MTEIYKLTMTAHSLFEQMFADDVFMDIYTAGAAMATWANTLKLVPVPGAKERALRYYQTARQICGNEPTIIEGIKYCEEVLLNQESRS